MSTRDQKCQVRLRITWQKHSQSVLLTLYSVSNMSLTARARKSQRAWLNLVKKEHENGKCIGEIIWHLTGFSTGEVAPPSKFDKISDSGPGLPRGPRGSLSEENHWKDRLHQLDSSPGEKFEGWIVAGKCCCWALWPASHLYCSNLSIFIIHYNREDSRNTINLPHLQWPTPPPADQWSCQTKWLQPRKIWLKCQQFTKTKNLLASLSWFHSNQQFTFIIWSRCQLRDKNHLASLSSGLSIFFRLRSSLLAASSLKRSSWNRDHHHDGQNIEMM